MNQAIRFLGVFVLLVFASAAWGQNPLQHNHPTNIQTVGGSEHPELIPDTVAYRLYLVTVSESTVADEETKARQLAHLSKVRLSPKDLLAIIPVLAEFKSAYNSLVNRYNQAAEAVWANGLLPDEKTFLQQRDDLVQATKTSLQRTLTPEGMAQLDAHIQGEKSKMVIRTNTQVPQ